MYVPWKENVVLSAKDADKTRNFSSETISLTCETPEIIDKGSLSRGARTSWQNHFVYWLVVYCFLPDTMYVYVICVCVYLCVSTPCNTLQYFFLVLVQTYSKGCVFSTADLHLVHLHLCCAQLLRKEINRRQLMHSTSDINILEK